MRYIFADTDYWVALLNPEDSLHQIALNNTQNLGEAIIITTYWVLLEFFNVITIRARPLRKRVVLALEGMRKNPNIVILPATRESFDEGVNIFGNRPNRPYSLTDCISMYEIQNRNIKEALSADRHFRQEGINTLLKV